MPDLFRLTEVRHGSHLWDTANTFHLAMLVLIASPDHTALESAHQKSPALWYYLYV